MARKTTPQLVFTSQAWIVAWDGIGLIDGRMDEADDRSEEDIRDELAEAGVEETEDQDAVLAVLRESIAGFMEEAI